AAKLSKKFSVLVDYDEIQPGQDWRSLINVWTGACDAAVALISPDALNSDYCRHEWSNLSFRRSLSENFIVIPVFYKVDPEELRKQKYDPINFRAIQGIKVATAAATCKQVLDRLKPVARDWTPAEFQARILADLLRKVTDEAFLKRAAD